MIFGSVCSGIEAASVAWHPLGWRAAWLAEIEPFPSAVLAHHYPQVPNLGDMTNFKAWPDGAIDLLCGGTPCQSFSVAGLRKGLDDPRGNLMLTFGAIAARYRPRWLVWENVPGVLSSNEGRDFGAFLGLLGHLGYGFAYRVLDAQYAGVAQRRRRVFVVGCLGDWRSAAAVLFERHSLSGHPAPRREEGQIAAGGAAPGAGVDFQNAALSGDIAGTLAAGAHAPAIAFNAAQDPDVSGEVAAPLGAQTNGMTNGVAYTTKLHNTASNNAGKIFEERATCLDANSPPPALLTAKQVRRLTPRECERLQGFPDDYTAIPWRTWQEAKRKGASYEGLLLQRGMTLRGPSREECPDGPRYKALGNSWAVPVVRWIGQRIEAVEGVHAQRRSAA